MVVLWPSQHLWKKFPWLRCHMTRGFKRNLQMFIRLQYYLRLSCECIHIEHIYIYPRMCLQITGCKIHMWHVYLKRSKYIYIYTYLYIHICASTISYHKTNFLSQNTFTSKTLLLLIFGHLMLVGKGKPAMSLVYVTFRSRWEAFLLGYLQHRCNLFPLNPS